MRPYLSFVIVDSVEGLLEHFLNAEAVEGNGSRQSESNGGIREVDDRSDGEVVDFVRDRFVEKDLRSDIARSSSQQIYG